MEKVCGYFDCEIEARFENMRTEETNCANFFSDITRTEFENCDLALFHSGTLRSNSIIPRGDVTIGMMNELIPMPDKVILMRISGDIVLSILENAVSEWPSHDGRFACVSGLKFSFDPDYPAGSRVHSVKQLDGHPFDLSRDAKYNLAVMQYIAMGRDGYDALRDPSVEWLVDAEAAMTF